LQQASPSATAGVPFPIQPVVAEEDQNGVIQTGDNTTQVTASLASGIGPLLGTTTVTLSAGKAIFTNLTDNVVDFIRLNFTAGSMVAGPSNITSVAGGPATLFIVNGFPTSIAAGAAGTVTVTPEDSFGNVDSGYVGTVHFTSTDGQAGLPADYTFVSTDKGSHSFSVTLKTAAVQSLTATDTGNASIKGSESGITVTPGAASQLMVAGFPTTITAGTAGTVTVTAKDAFGNVATGYAGAVHFTSTDKLAGLPANYTFVSADKGAHSFNVTLKTAAPQSLTATDTGNAAITGTEPGIVVTAAATSQFSVSGFPSPSTAGVAATATVTTRDAFGNSTTGYLGTVHFTSTDKQAVLPADYTFVSADNGSHSFSVTLKTAATQSLTATDKTTASITGTQSGIVVTSAAAGQLVASGFPASITAGAAGNLTVTAKDIFGNVATGYVGIVHFASTDAQATLPANYTFVSADKGSHSFSITLKTLGTQSLTATDQGNASLTASQSGIVVTAAVASRFSVSGFPTSITAGSAGTVTVTATNAAGIVATGYVGTVHFTSTDLLAGLPANYTFVSADKGSHSFSVTLKTAATQSLTATDANTASITGTQSGITVKPGAAAQVSFAALPPSTTAGAFITPAITAQIQDSFGNLLTGDNSDTVTLAATGGPGGFTSGSTTSATVSGGVASFGNLIVSAAGAYTLTATAAGFTASTMLHVARMGLPPSWLTAVASDLTHSSEYYAIVVTAAYKNYLGRPPDSAGLASWVSQMHQGLTDEHLEANFIGSNEYIQAHGGAGAGWITGMYKNLLGRTPSQAEVNTWLQALANGESTVAIAYGFAASAERERQVVSANCQQYLGRAPTSAEVTSLVNAFENGSETNEDIVAGFVGSAEYFRNHYGNASDWFASAYEAILGVPAGQIGAAPSFLTAMAGSLTHSSEYYSGIVTAAYQRYLGRTPDSAGLASWVAQMQKGLTDEHLEAAFIGSNEFIQNHGGLGSGWITAMYQSLLGRTPSQAEINQWLQALANGVSTTSIAYQFAASAERESQRVTADYQQYLGRAPTAAEVAGWVNRFESGTATNEDVVAGFVGSVEYYQKHKSDSQDWWNQAVQALFGASGF
jgi:hypothetical protein